jgi:hypothetical protein
VSSYLDGNSYGFSGNKWSWRRYDAVLTVGRRRSIPLGRSRSFFYWLASGELAYVVISILPSLCRQYWPPSNYVSITQTTQDSVNEYKTMIRIIPFWRYYRWLPAMPPNNSEYSHIIWIYFSMQTMHKILEFPYDVSRDQIWNHVPISHSPLAAGIYSTLSFLVFSFKSISFLGWDFVF